MLRSGPFKLCHPEQDIWHIEDGSIWLDIDLILHPIIEAAKQSHS